MSIVVTCPSCKKTLRLADAMAGRTGACRECGASITVPDNPEPLRPPDEKPLGKASLDDIAQELARRGLTAVVSVIGGGGASGLGVVHYTAEPMEDDRLERLFTAWARQAASKNGATTSKGAEVSNGGAPKPHASPASVPAKPAPAPPAAAPPSGEASDDDFTFKGDALGMSLGEFRMKHERTAPGHRRRMPWCSDENPDADIPDLMSEPWHAQAGIIHARLDLPEENASPTIAGVRTDAVIYQFVDDRLFQITGFFSPDGFNPILAALRTRYGKPQHEDANPRVLQWWKVNTSLELISGRLHPRTPGVVRYYHDELLAEASTRKPSATSDL